MSFRLLAAWLLCACLLPLPTAASAQYIDPKRIESSLLVTGTIDVAADGSVLGYTLDQPGKLPRPVLNLVAGTAPQWKFEPVSEPAPQRLAMSLRFIAKRTDDTHFTVDLRSAAFAMPSASADALLALDPASRSPLQYPYAMQELGVAATVYVALRIHPDGTTDAMVRRVDLHTAGSPAQLEQWRKAFARNAIAACRKWRYRVPTQGADAGRPFWIGTQPIGFHMAGSEPAYGVWETYLPGPEAVVPWETDADRDSDYDALSANDIAGASTRRRLLTPLDR